MHRSLALAAALSLVACSSEGPAGPTGPSGPAGPQGPAASATVPTPGTGRLRVSWTRARAAGLDAVFESRLVDTERSNEACRPMLAFDGVQRCLPANVWEEGRWWADAACTQAYAHGLGLRDGKMVYVLRPREKGAQVIDTVRGDRPSKAFVLSGATCVEVNAPTHVDLLKVGSEVGASSFAEVGTSVE